VVRYRGSSVVVAIGGVLLAAAIGHHLLEIRRLDQVLGPALALSLDAGLAITLVCAGVWLRRTDLTDAEEWPVAVYTAVGALAGVALEALILLVHIIERRPIDEPQFRLLVAAGGGAIVLFVAGYYSASRQAVISRYESLFDNAVQFTGLLESDGRLVEVNDTALEFGGFEREEVVGEQFTELRWWTHSETTHERIREAIERAGDGEFVRYEAEVQGAGGLRTIDFSATPVTNEHGEVRQVVVEGRDISDQKQQRQHLQVLHRVMRHNIRNDITKLRLWTREIVTAPTPEERDSHASRVMGTLDSWEELTSDLTDIRRAIDSEQVRSHTEAVETVVTDAVDTERTTHPTAEIRLTLSETAGAQIPAVARTALCRAVDNAVKADPDDEPTVSVSVSDADADWVDIEVTDNRSEIPDAEAAVLETGEETPLTHGDGLGVWKVRMLVKEAAGDVTVSTSDEGTTLTLRLPKKGHIEDPGRAAAAG
jgi:PAS domain S-box-containing protein